MRCLLLGVGAMASPRYRPAGLLVVSGRTRLMFDGGPTSAPPTPVQDWLVTDEHAELAREIRSLGSGMGLAPAVRSIHTDTLQVEPLPVRHTSHPTFGYRIIEGRGAVVVWAPEFLAFPEWARHIFPSDSMQAGLNTP